MDMGKYSNENIFDKWPFGKINYILFFVGLATIALGYVLMYTGDTYSFQSISLSPFILVIGYCIIIPLAVLIKDKS